MSVNFSKNFMKDSDLYTSNYKDPRFFNVCVGRSL